MEMYDEDLTNNTFFRSLQSDNPVLYDIAATRRWLICIPRQGSLGKCQFTDKDFENHVIFHDEERKEDSHYCTANKKELRIRNNILTTGHGFKEHRVVPILFEETFFNKNDESYQVLCINQPLEGATSYGPDPGSISKQFTLHHIADCADLLWKKNDNAKIGQLLNAHMQQFVQGLVATDNTKLQPLVSTTKIFYAKGIHIVMKDSKLKKRCQNEEGMHETVKIALESYLLHNVYKRLFVNICTATAVKDSRLNRITRNLRDLQLKDLDVRPEFCQNVPKARKEFCNLVRYFTPLGKLICLKRVFRVLMQVSGTHDFMPLTTDDLLPMVMFLIVKAEEGHWWATFSYVTQFRFAKPNNDDEYGFFLATMEAALEHISSNQLGAYLQSRRTKELSQSCSPVKRGTLWQQQEQQTSRLNQYFQFIHNSDLRGMKDILSNKQSPLIDTSLLCHPLCDCDKCMQVIKSSQEANEEFKVSLDSVDDRGWTGLHMAAYCGHVEILDWLLQQKVDVNLKDIQGHTPLHIACMAGRQSATLLLLHHGARPNVQDNENNTALHLATLHGYEECVKALVYYDQSVTVLDMDIANDFGDTALHLASKWGYLSICEILIENGASVKIRNRKNQSAMDVSHNLKITHLFATTIQQAIKTFTRSVQKGALQLRQRRHSAPSHSHLKALAAKVSSRARLSVVEKDVAKAPVRSNVKPQPSPKVEKLLKAVQNKDLELAKYHLSWDDNSDSDSEVFSQSPFSNDKLCHPLCQCPKCAPVQQLRSPVGKDVHINSQNVDGVSAIHVAAQCGYLDLSRLFLQKGALVNLVTYAEGHTPLHLAIKNQRSELVELLLRNRAEVNMADARGNTALHHAAMTGLDTVLTWLLDYSGDKDLQNNKGNTPLHESCQAGHIICVRILVAYGANVNIRNNANKLPSQLTQKEKILRILKYAKQLRETEGQSPSKVSKEVDGCNSSASSQRRDGIKSSVQSTQKSPTAVVIPTVTVLKHKVQPKELITKSNNNNTVSDKLQSHPLTTPEKKLHRSNTDVGVLTIASKGQLGAGKQQELGSAGVRVDQVDSGPERKYNEGSVVGRDSGTIVLRFGGHTVYKGSNLLKRKSSSPKEQGSELQMVMGGGSSEFWSAVGMNPDIDSDNNSGTSGIDKVPVLPLSPTGCSTALINNQGLSFQDEYFCGVDQMVATDGEDIHRHHPSCPARLMAKQSDNLPVDADIRRGSHQMPESLQTCCHNAICDSLSEDSRTESEKDLPIE